MASKRKSAVSPRSAGGRSRVVHDRPRPPAGSHRRTDTVWLYGSHAVHAALANPGRRCLKLLTLSDAMGTPVGPGPIEPQVVERAHLEAVLPPGAVHQGLALLVAPLRAPDLEEIVRQAQARSTLVLLDHVTDPHNVGAVLRSAAAFGADAVIATERHAPGETGALAKTACGALELVPLLRVANLAQTIARLKDDGYWCLGLAGEAQQRLDQVAVPDRTAFVFGAEGAGLRRLTRERCDLLVRLPTMGPIRDLNVSNAVTVALYETARQDPAGRSEATGSDHTATSLWSSGRGRRN
jgi:23S rRNA (guanosine2251-2'-O)-methyltransferase